MIERYTKDKVSSFQERFTELCESKATTDSALAEKLGVSKQTISSWKSGYRSPKLPMVELIAREFNVNAYWLIGYDFPKSGSPSLYINGSFPIPADRIKPTEKERLARMNLSVPVGVKVTEEPDQPDKVSGVKFVSDSNRTISDKDEKAVKIARFIGKLAKEDPESALEILKIVVDKDMI